MTLQTQLILFVFVLIAIIAVIYLVKCNSKDDFRNVRGDYVRSGMSHHNPSHTNQQSPWRHYTSHHINPVDVDGRKPEVHEINPIEVHEVNPVEVHEAIPHYSEIKTYNESLQNEEPRTFNGAEKPMIFSYANSPDTPHFMISNANNNENYNASYHNIHHNIHHSCPKLSAENCKHFCSVPTLSAEKCKHFCPAPKVVRQSPLKEDIDSYHREGGACRNQQKAMPNATRIGYKTVEQCKGICDSSHYCTAFDIARPKIENGQILGDCWVHFYDNISGLHIPTCMESDSCYCYIRNKKK